MRFWQVLILILFAVGKASPAPADGHWTRVADLIAKDLYYSRQSGLLYATVASNSPKLANTVVILDPSTGSVSGSIPVGHDPSLMAPSDDGKYLFVAIDGDNGIQRIRLAERVAEAEFLVNFTPTTGEVITGKRLTRSLKVVPGTQDTVVVSQAVDYFRHIGLAVYRGGIQLPKVTPPDTGWNNVTLTEQADTLWCYDNESTAFGLQKLHVDDKGIEAVGSSFSGLACCYGGELQYRAGLLYASNTPAHVFDPETHVIRGSYIFPWGLRSEGGFSIDEGTGIIYFSDRSYWDTFLFSFDLTRFTLLGVYQGQVLSGAAKGLTIAGGNLAAIDSETGQIFLFGLDLLQPVEPVTPTITELDDGVRVLSLPNWGIGYDSHSDRIYATTPSASGNNSLLAIDPVTLSIRSSFWAGSDPFRMAITSDGHYLYHGFLGSTYLQRVDLNTFVPDLEIPLFGGQDYQRPDLALSLDVMPGTGESLAVTGLGFFNPYLGGSLSPSTMVYDGTVPRPLHSGFGGVNLQVDSSSTRLFTGEHTLRVSAEGVHEPAELWSNGPATGRVRCQDDVCFSSAGEVFDTNANRMMGHCSPVGGIGYDLGDVFGVTYGSVAPDLPNRRVYYVLRGDQKIVLSSCNLDTFLVSESATISGIEGLPGDLLLWRPDQLAFTNLDALFTVPKSALKPLPQIPLPTPSIRGGYVRLDFSSAGLGAYDPIRRKLYVPLRHDNGPHGNSIATVDPSTGRVESATHLGGEPGFLVPSGDGNFLYVQLYFSNMVARFNLATQIVDLRIPLPSGSLHDMRVQPGNPDTIAIAVDNKILLFRGDKLVGAPVDVGTSSLDFNEKGDRLYALAGDMPRNITRLRADSTGLSVEKTVAQHSIGERIRCVGTTVVDDQGRIFDAETLRLLDQIGNVGDGAVIDTQNRILFGYYFAGLNPGLSAYGLDSRTRIGWWPTEIAGTPVPCGADRLALFDNIGSITFLPLDTMQRTLPLPTVGQPVRGSGIIRLNASATAMAYDPGSRLLLAVTSPNGGPDGNKLVRVDPSTGMVIDKLPLGGNPSYIVVDRVYGQAFIGLDGPRAIAQVDLASHRINTMCSVPDPVYGSLGIRGEGLVSEGALPLPGSAGSLAVILGGDGLFVAAMDRCVTRQNIVGPVGDAVGPLSLSPDGKKIYGSPFIAWNITETGLSGPTLGDYPYLPDRRPSDKWVMCGPFFYTGAGQIYDPVSKSIIGDLQVTQSGSADSVSALTCDLGQNVIYYVKNVAMPDDPSQAGIELSAYSLATGKLLGSTTFVRPEGDVVSVEACDRYVALLTSMGELLIVPTASFNQVGGRVR